VQLTPVLASLLVHDFLLAKRGVGTSVSHPLHSAILRHKARLNAEFTKARLRRGFSSLEALRESINQGADGSAQDLESETTDGRHPRWLRINTLKTTLQKQMESTFESFTEVASLSSVLKANRDAKVFTKDRNVDDLIALPPGYDLSKLDAYQKGEIVVQDKASCFPAFLLDPASMTGDIIDACAAPGNKTTHLAALLCLDKSGKRVIAFEKDKNRTHILRKMVGQAGADRVVHVNGSTDFLTTTPDKYPNITAILLDPSCSGSGIVGRDDGPKMELPSSPFNVVTGQSQPANPSQSSEPSTRKVGNSRKRKRMEHANMGPSNQVVDTLDKTKNGLDVSNNDEQDENELKRRLESLSAFQLKLLRHAMSFPAVERIVYSTCSIHEEENECIVVKALMAGKDHGWGLLLRNQQAEGLARWEMRGDAAACSKEIARLNRGGLIDLDLSNSPWSARQIADACIRCRKGEGAGTIGFFVAGLVRDCMKDGTTAACPVGQPELVESENENSSEKEWAGFSDEDTGP
jgi:putative methyltransferase